MKPRHPLHWQSLDRKALQQAQTDKLRAYLARTVLPFSAYYRDLFQAHDLRPESLRSFADLMRLPLTSKSDLTGRVRDFVLAPDRKVLARRPDTIARALVRGREAVGRELEREFRPLMLTSTTGRSNEPMPFIYTERDIENLGLAGVRLMRVCAATREMRILNMFPFAPHLAFWQAHYAGTEFGVFMVSSGGGKTMGTDGNLRLIKKINPEAIIGMPTFVYHVLRAALAEDVKMPQLAKIVLGGEKVPPGMRRKLRALAQDLGTANVDVLPTYGFTEAKMAWPQCPCPDAAGASGYHLYPDLGIIEIVDPSSGRQLGDGESGEIVWTPLDARGTVVLRYRTGDIAEGGIVHGRCPYCGRNVPRIMGQISRTSEIKEMRLDKLKGTLIDFNELEHVLDNCDHIGTWQLEIRKMNDDPLEIDELILHAQKLDSVADERLREELNQRFAAATEIHPNRIIFQSEEELRKMQGVGSALKEARVVDHRPKASATIETASPPAQESKSRPPSAEGGEPEPAGGATRG